MALDFYSSRFLRHTTAPSFSVPITVSFWFYPTDSTSTVQRLLNFQDTNCTKWAYLILNGATGVVQSDLYDGRIGPPGPSASGVNFNAWNHLYMVFAGGSNTCYMALNDGSLQVGSGTTTTGMCTRSRIGDATVGTTGAGQVFTGRMAEFGLWLSDLEVYSTSARHWLAAGYTPLHVRDSAKLSWYLPMYQRNPVESTTALLDEVSKTSWAPSVGMAMAPHPPNIKWPKSGKYVIRTPPVVTAHPRSYGFVFG